MARVQDDPTQALLSAIPPESSSFQVVDESYRCTCSEYLKTLDCQWDIPDDEFWWTVLFCTMPVICVHVATGIFVDLCKRKTLSCSAWDWAMNLCILLAFDAYTIYNWMGIYFTYKWKEHVKKTYADMEQEEFEYVTHEDPEAAKSYTKMINYMIFFNLFMDIVVVGLGLFHFLGYFGKSINRCSIGTLLAVVLRGFFFKETFQREIVFWYCSDDISEAFQCNSMGVETCLAGLGCIELTEIAKAEKEKQEEIDSKNDEDEEKKKQREKREQEIEYQALFICCFVCMLGFIIRVLFQRQTGFYGYSLPRCNQKKSKQLRRMWAFNEINIIQGSLTIYLQLSLFFAQKSCLLPTNLKHEWKHQIPVILLFLWSLFQWITGMLRLGLLPKFLILFNPVSSDYENKQLLSVYEKFRPFWWRDWCAHGSKDSRQGDKNLVCVQEGLEQDATEDMETKWFYRVVNAFILFSMGFLATFAAAQAMRGAAGKL